MYTSAFIHVYGSKLYCFVDPPAITGLRVTDICTNDITVSWTAASNEEGLSYNVVLLPSSMTARTAVDVMMDTSYNFTGLMQNTNYDVSVASTFKSTLCIGIPTTSMMVTTLSVRAGVPMSELIVVNIYVHTFEIP